MSVIDEIKNAKKIVVKVGTSTLTHNNGKLNLRRMERLTRVLSNLKNQGRDVILVTSGAVGVGVSKLALSERPRDTIGKQAAAAVGQCELMNIYGRLFSEYGYTVAQVLLTKDIVDHSKREENAKNALTRLEEMGVIPIINENDTVSVEEIKILAQNVKKASRKINTASYKERYDALMNMAQSLRDEAEYILSENEKDLKATRERNISEGLYDRLRLTKERISSMP